MLPGFCGSCVQPDQPFLWIAVSRGWLAVCHNKQPFGVSCVHTEGHCKMQLRHMSLSISLGQGFQKIFSLHGQCCLYSSPPPPLLRENRPADSFKRTREEQVTREKYSQDPERFLIRCFCSRTSGNGKDAFVKGPNAYQLAASQWRFNFTSFPTFFYITTGTF